MKKILCKIAGILAIIGAINWGLVGLFDVNLVHIAFKAMPQVEKIVYILIGLSGVVFAGLWLTDTKSH